METGRSGRTFDSGLSRVAFRTARRVAETLAPAGRRARLSILIYHRVRRVSDPLFPDELDADAFDRHLAVVSGLFNILSLREAIARLRSGALPPRPACLTFDDGYADNADVALPLLKRYGLTATFFISAGYLDGGRMWNDTVIESVRQAAGEALDLSSIGLGFLPIGSEVERSKAIHALISRLKYLEPAERSDRCDAIRQLAKAAPPDDLMMTSAQVRQLHAAGMQIGAHTVSHPILARTSLEVSRREISEGRAALEALIGDKVPLFAYPNGKPRVDYAEEHVALTRELGFEGAVSTGWGVACAATDPYQLPRFTPWDRSAAGIALRLLRNLAAPVDGVPH